MTLSWKTGGLLLGLVFFAAVALVKPIGVSTQFVILDGAIWSLFDASAVVADAGAKSGFTSSNAYLAGSGGKYAAQAAAPLTYGMVFVLAMALGGFVSSRLRGGNGASENAAPAAWRANFGDRPAARHVAVFLAGILVLFGARLAGGCTSGHMMSGLMQTSISGFLFAAGAFAAAIPAALLIYSKEA